MPPHSCSLDRGLFSSHAILLPFLCRRLFLNMISMRVPLLLFAFMSHVPHKFI